MENISEEQNLQNMRQCPRFGGCDIARCPLDFWAEDRVELKEDPKCKMWRYYRGFRPRGSIGHLVPRLRDRIVAIRGLKENQVKGLKVI